MGGVPCGGRKGPQPEAWEVSRDSALSWIPLPSPAPGRTWVRTPRPPPRGEPSPGCGPAGLGGQGAARAKGEGPAAASAAACGGGRRGRTRAEGEGSHLGEVPGWSQPPGGAERFSCPPRLSPADPERSFPEKNAPRVAGPRSRPEPPRGKGAAPRLAGRGRPRSWGADGRDVGAAIPARARRSASAGGRGGGRPGLWTPRSLLSAAGLHRPGAARGRDRILTRGVPVMSGCRICSPRLRRGLVTLERVDPRTWRPLQCSQATGPRVCARPRWLSAPGSAASSGQGFAPGASPQV